MKEKLADYLLENCPFLSKENDKELVNEILNELDKIKALNPLWNRDEFKSTFSNLENLKENDEQKKLPSLIFLKTPMFQGDVKLEIKEGNFIYVSECDDSFKIVSAKSVNEMIRKLNRYGVVV